MDREPRGVLRCTHNAAGTRLADNPGDKVPKMRQAKQVEQTDEAQISHNIARRSTPSERATIGCVGYRTRG